MELSVEQITGYILSILVPIQEELVARKFQGRDEQVRIVRDDQLVGSGDDVLKSRFKNGTFSLDLQEYVYTYADNSEPAWVSVAKVTYCPPGVVGDAVSAPRRVVGDIEQEIVPTEPSLLIYVKGYVAQNYISLARSDWKQLAKREMDNLLKYRDKRSATLYNDPTGERRYYWDHPEFAGPRLEAISNRYNNIRYDIGFLATSLPSPEY